MLSLGQWSGCTVKGQNGVKYDTLGASGTKITKVRLLYLPGMGLQDFPNTCHEKDTALRYNRTNTVWAKIGIQSIWMWPLCLCVRGQTHLCGVVNILEGRVTGHHGSKIREGAQAIDPALSKIWLGALKKLNHWRNRGRINNGLIEWMQFE